MTAHVKPKALENFKARDFRMLIDGVWTEGAGPALERVAPGHGVVVSRYPAGTRADAERAIAAARKAFDDGPWPRMTGAERSNILLKAADLIAARADELAFLDCIESGKPISQAKGELGAHYRLGWEEKRKAGQSLVEERGLIDLPDRMPEGVTLPGHFDPGSSGGTGALGTGGQLPDGAPR